jgi:DNA-binding transcriptional LysR family regulator
MWGVAAKWWHHRAVDQLQTMKVFVRVAQRAGFAAAARDLSMSPAAVTKHVAALEARIRARLFDRTTRSVSLTEAGRAYLERCLECLQAFEDAEDSINRAGDKPAGRLRVTAPVDFGPGIMASLSRYMNRYPDVVVDLQLSNRAVDLVDEGFDVSLRIAPSLTGQYVARPLAVTRVAILAAPDYLRRYGRPRTPDELAKHRREANVCLSACHPIRRTAARLHALHRGHLLAPLPSILPASSQRRAVREDPADARAQRAPSR